MIQTVAAILSGIMCAFAMIYATKAVAAAARSEGAAEAYRDSRSTMDKVMENRNDCLLVLSRVMADIRGQAHEDLTHLDSFKDAQKLLDGCIIIRGERLN